MVQLSHYEKGEEKMLTYARKIFDGILWNRVCLELRKQESTNGRIQDLELVPLNGRCHGGGGP